MNLKKTLFFVAVLFAVSLTVWAYPFNYETCNLGYKHVHHEHNEASYQKVWCDAHNGIMEYENTDFK